MVKSTDCDQSNAMVFLNKIERLENRIHQLEVEKEHIYDGLERLFEKIEEIQLKCIKKL